MVRLHESSVALVLMNNIGDVVCTTVFGKKMIFINSVKAIRDLVEKRSVNYADRPDLPLLCIVLVTFFI